MNNYRIWKVEELRELPIGTKFHLFAGKTLGEITEIDGERCMKFDDRHRSANFIEQAYPWDKEIKLLEQEDTMHCNQCSAEIDHGQAQAYNGRCQKCAEAKEPTLAKVILDNTKPLNLDVIVEKPKPEYKISDLVPAPDGGWRLPRGRGEKPEPDQDSLIKAWRHSIDDNLYKNKLRIDKIFDLIGFLNQQPNMRLAFLQMPDMKFGKASSDQLVSAYMAYDLLEKVPTVPKSVQVAFVQLVNLLVEQYEVLSFDIGFRSTFSMKSESPSFDLNDKSLNDCPMVRIGVRI